MILKILIISTNIFIATLLVYGSEQEPLYFFCREDFENHMPSNQMVKKSLYARYDSLPLDLQDYIISYLQQTKLSDVKDSGVGSFVLIDDIEWKEKLKPKFEYALLSYGTKKEHFLFIKDCLQVAYWNRYVKRARNKHEMINNRMTPSEIVLNKNKYNHVLEKICLNNCPEYDLEIALLMIACGALTHQKKDQEYTPLYQAIKIDSLPMVKLLVHAGLSRPHGSSKSVAYQDFTAMHVAARYNAVKTISYLRSIGHNLNLQTKTEKETPLHEAYFYENHQAIQLLQDLGADQNIKDWSGKKYNESCSFSYYKKKRSNSSK